MFDYYLGIDIEGRIRAGGAFEKGWPYKAVA